MKPNRFLVRAILALALSLFSPFVTRLAQAEAQTGTGKLLQYFRVLWVDYCEGECKVSPEIGGYCCEVVIIKVPVN